MALKKIIVAATLVVLILPAGSLAKRKGLKFESPDGWVFLLGRQFQEEEAERVVRAAQTAQSIGLPSIGESGKFFFQIKREPGDYYSAAIFMMPPESEVRPLWTPKSQIVIRLKNGNEITSDGCFFADSKSQTQMWDTRKRRCTD